MVHGKLQCYGPNMEVDFCLRSGFRVLFALYYLFLHQNSSILKCGQSHAVTAQLTVVYFTPEPLQRCCHAVVVQDDGHAHLFTGRRPSTELPSGPLHIAACLIYFRPSLLWCKPHWSIFSMGLLICLYCHYQSY